MKNQLRLFAKEKRKSLNLDLLSDLVAKNLFSIKEYKKAKNILCYSSLKHEIKTFFCFEDSSKTWYLPRVNGNNLEVCLYDSAQLCRGSFNIQEPLNEKIQNLAVLDMVIIPCIAADKNGYRIGYGKGYYDRFLPYLKEDTLKVVLTCSDLLFDTVYPDKYDVRADIIVTDKEILRL